MISAHLIINIHTILLRSKPIRHGYGRRKRPAAQDRTTTTGPKRHQLNTIWHRVNTKSASKQNQSKNADVILDTLTSFSIRLCHSQYTDVILDMLTSLLMRWRHSRYTDMIHDTLTPFPFTKCPATFLIEQTTGPNFAYSPLFYDYIWVYRIDFWYLVSCLIMGRFLNSWSFSHTWAQPWKIGHFISRHWRLNIANSD